MNIAELRKAKGVTQKQLASTSGISIRVLQSYENGARNINLASGDNLYRLSLVLGCQMEDLLENKEVIFMDVLFSIYKEWRRQADEHNKWEEEHGGSLPLYWETDCGEEGAREDFSNFANLEEVISFEDMLKLERMYE